MQLRELKESKKKLKAASAIAKLGYWKLELDANTLSWSDEVYTIWGRTKEDFEVNFENFFQTIHPDDRAVFELEQNASFAGEKEHDFTHRIILPNGDIRWVHELGRLVKDKNGIPIAFEGTVRNITEQKNRELEQNLISQISEIFNNEESLNNATQKLCEVFINFGDFDLAEIWLPNIEKSEIQLKNYHNQSEITAEFYQEASNVSSLNIGEGLPGTIWKTKKAVLWDDVHSKEHFIRRKAAIKVGITSLLGIPLIFKEEIAGVLVIGSKNKTDKLLQYSKIFYRLETFIGSEINRKQLENSLNYLFEAIPDIICLIDFNGRFLKMNKAGCLLLGHTENEILYQSFENFVHPDDINVSRNEIKKLKEGATVFKFENRYITKKKEVVWLSWTCNAELKEGVIYASAKDITTEKKLRELNRQANSIARIGSWEIDLIENKIFWTDVVHQLHETDPKTFVPDLVKGINFYRKDFREMIRQNIYLCISEGKSFNFEAALVTAKNNERWVRVIGDAELVDGKCIRIYGSFQDIHEVKEAEIRLQSLADNLPGVMFQYVLNPDGTDSLKYASKGGAAIWGVKPEEAMKNVNLIWDQIKAGGDFEEVQQSIAESIKSKNKWIARWRHVMPSGELRTHTGYGTPDYLSDGTVVFNSLVLDITEEIKNEELLEQATSMAKIGSWELDLINQNEDTMYWSPIIKQILEVDEDYNPSLTGGFEFYTEKSKVLIQDVINTLINDGIEFDEELLLITATGKNRWVRCIGKSERIKGKCIKIFGSFQDIHTAKMLQLQLSEILGSISDAFYTLDKNWNFTYFNKEAENLLQKKSADVIGKNIWQEFPTAIATPLEEIYYRVVQSGESVSFEYFFPGDEKWYEINAYPSNGGISVYFKNIDERKQAKEKLEKAYIEKNNIIESIGDAFFTMDKNFTVSYWNRAAEELIGVKREQLIGKNLWDVFPDAVSLPSYTNYHQVLATGKPITFEDNYGIWLEVNAYPSEEGITVFFRDISLRKKILDAYEERNKILESIGDAFFAVDNEWIVSYWNKEAENVLDKKRELMMGKNLWEEYADAIDTDSYRQYHLALETQKNISFEEHYQTLNKWFEVSVYPSPDGLSVYFKDITLRKHADVRLQQANERFEKVTQATNDGIWDFKIKENTLFWGIGFKKLFGYDLTEVNPTMEFWTENIHPDDLEVVQESLLRIEKNIEFHNWKSEYRFKRVDGSYAFVEDRAVIIRNKEGKATRIIGAVTDISERKLQEIKLKEANESLKKYAHELELSNEQLEQFAFIASHDLQEPLRMITSFMNQLERKYSSVLDKKAHEYIYFATDGAKRMKQIILDLLEYSRAGKFEEKKEMVHLIDLIDDYKTLRRKIIEEKSVVINCSDLLIIEAYRVPLIQTLHSLLDNAIKYTFENVSPVISIRLENKGENWLFIIKDNGIGISEQFFKKIFIIFQRLHSRNEYTGTGIGLSIAKKNIESWGGQIWLESEEGKGTTFYFTLPKNQ